MTGALTVLFVVHQFLPKHIAGTELYTRNLAVELERRGHRSVVFTTEAYAGEPQSTMRRKTHQGLEVWEAVHNNAFPNFEASYLDPEKEGQFREVLDAVQPDVVHVQHLHQHSLAYVDIAKAAGIRVVYTLHEFWLMCVHHGWLARPGFVLCEGPQADECARCAAWMPASRDGLSQLDAWNARDAAVRAMLDRVDLLVSPSRFLRDRFLANGYASPERLIYSDNGMRLPEPSVSRRPDAEASDSRIRFGFVGTVAEWKGVHVLVEAMNSMPEGVELGIHGVLEYFPDYVQQLRELARHPGIDFAGRFENDRIGEVLADIDVLVVPSLWYENSPLTIHEAFLAGVPVIASDIGGMAEYVDDGVNGLHFGVGDAAQLAKQMRRCVEEEGLVDSLRGGFPEFKSIESDAADWEARYLKLTSGGSPD